MRHWLAAGAASAGMAASLWGLSLAVPELAVAAADDGASASSNNAGTSHAPRSVRSVHTAQRSISARPPLPSAKTEDSDGQTTKGPGAYFLIVHGTAAEDTWEASITEE